LAGLLYQLSWTRLSGLDWCKPGGWCPFRLLIAARDTNQLFASAPGGAKMSMS
jgi:hypothetical protein